MSVLCVSEIAAQGSLDGITVFWTDQGIGKGSVTIVSWGSAWTCYFGAMPESTIQEFFAEADIDYLVNKLGITQWLKQSKRHEQHLSLLIRAIKEHIKAERAAA